MTLIIDGQRAYCKCDTCGTESERISNTNKMRAQRVAIDFWGWTVRNENSLWKHSCRACVEIWKAKQK